MSKIRFEPKHDANKGAGAASRPDEPKGATPTGIPAVQGEAEALAFALTPSESQGQTDKPAKKARRPKSD